VIDIGYRPRGWQARVHRERKRFSVLVVHRRAGKTVFAVHELLFGDPARGLKGALTTPNGRFAYVAPFYAQAKAVAWDILKASALKVPGVVIRESELKVELPNGATIRLFGADNANALRGLGFDGVVVDEVADIEPGVWGEVIRPALSDRRGWALFIGTAKGINLFSELYYKAARQDEGYEGWYAKRLTVYETDDALHPEEVEAARRDMTPAQFAAEYLCEFSAGGVDILIPADLVEEAASRSIAEREYTGFGIAIGVDPARFGDDSTALCVRQGPAVLRLQRESGLDTMEVADLGLALAEEFRAEALFVDDGGLGAGVVDRMRQLGHAPIAVNFGTRSPIAKYANTRARLWGEMKDWLKHGSLPNDLLLKTDLSAPTFKFDAQHRIVLESKADMKKRGLRSPDAADALALTFYSPVPARTSSDLEQFLRRSGARQYQAHGAEYDIFAQE
jgi:hypothetical protein